jgi:signal transduction histidine kinase/FixJ family two-component response regulator
MNDKISNASLKSKVAVGYLLILLASGMGIFFLYTGIKNLQLLDKNSSKPNAKLFKINQILTLIYEAENQTRSYFLLRNKSDFDNYIQTLNIIGDDIDTLTIACFDNPKQIRQLNTIKGLLLQKKDVIRQLMEIKSPDKHDFLYTRALEEVYIQAYELSKMSRIVKEKVTITRDSVIETPQKKGLLKRIFSANDQGSSNKPKMTIERKTQSDSVIQEGISPDTVVKTLQHALDNLRQRENYIQDQSIAHETELLYNDRMLLDKIREIATFLETEELQTINSSLSRSSSILHNASYVSMLLAIISVVVIVIFLMLIFRDISMARRHQLAMQTAAKQAEELMKLKEQFLANMSHEIRTPLGTIIGFTEQLLKTKLESGQRLFADTIDKASGHLLGLVNDILDLSKIEAGKFTLEKVLFNLNDLITEVCHSFSLKAEEKHIEIWCNVSADLNCELIGDPFRIRQVLINIIGNALKFTDEGAVTVNAEIRSSEGRVLWTKISVTDSGIGIPMEKQNEIFEYFSQADSGTSRKYGGTGLGLAISRRIIELHEGNISLQSTLGKGSTFVIELPMEVPEHSAKSQVPAIEKSDKSISMDEIAARLNGRRILVVDDDQTTLMLISSLLTNIGLDSDILTDSLKAIEMLEQKTFDLVLTDIHMPGLSGIELLGLIRNHPNVKIKQVPVIASTANVTDKSEILKSGFTGYLSKPFKEESFYEKVIGVLSPGFSVLLQPNKQKLQQMPERTVSYSFEEISGFTGSDPEAMKLVVSTFVEKSLVTINEIKQLCVEKNVSEISFRAHKLLPSFKQFRILELTDDLVKLERYEEYKLSQDQFFSISQKLIDKAVPILRLIKEDAS